MPLIDELFSKVYPNTDYICSPFVARGGVTLLHGRKSLGKSPFSWELARCVANGLPFLGFPTHKGRVLFIEKDTPEQLSMARLEQMPEPRGGWYVEFLTQESLDLGVIHKGMEKLRGYEMRWGPFDFVVWNPLARLYKGTDRDIPGRVYDSMTHLFPQAGHLVISHDRKEDRNPQNQSIDAQEHSGWQEWVNLAQNVFRLVPQTQYVEIRHTGSQTGKMHDPIRFVLTHNNSSVALWQRVENIQDLVASAPGETQRERVAYVAVQQKRSEETIWRALRDSKKSTDIPPT
jgi:hypothetical protein